MKRGRLPETLYLAEMRIALNNEPSDGDRSRMIAHWLALPITNIERRLAPRLKADYAGCWPTARPDT